MDKKIENFVKNNPNLFPILDITSLKTELKNIALLEPYGPCFEDKFKLLFKTAELTPFDETKADCYDLVFAPLLLSSLNSREAVSRMLSFSSAIKSKGYLYVSFYSLKKLELVKGVEKPCYHDESKSFTEYRYRSEDMIAALSSMHLVIKAIEEVDDVIVLLAQKV